MFPQYFDVGSINGSYELRSLSMTLKMNTCCQFHQQFKSCVKSILYMILSLKIIGRSKAIPNMLEMLTSVQIHKYTNICVLGNIKSYLGHIFRHQFSQKEQSLNILTLLI